MDNKIQSRCLNCGRLYKIGFLNETALSERIPFGESPQKASSFCPICEAKIKKDAEGTQKDLKPM